MPEPLRVRLPADAPRRAVLGTAYLMMSRAHCLLAQEDGETVLQLWPRAGERRAGLAAEARRVYAGQVARWALAEAGEGVRVELARRMVASAARAAAQPQAAGALTPEQEGGLAALVTEAGESERDPLGIKTPWSELRR